MCLFQIYYIYVILFYLDFIVYRLLQCIALHAPAYVCIVYPCILLVSHFSYIKGFLSRLAAQAYKPQVVPSRYSSESQSFLKANKVFHIG